MDELLEAVRKLMAHDDREAVVGLLKKHAKPVFQLAFDEGHGVAKSQLDPKITKLEEEKQAIAAERDEAKKALQKKGKDSTDVEKLEADYQKAIAEKDEEIASLKDQHATDRKEWRRGQALERLRATLAPQCEEGYEELLVERSTTRDRFSFDDDGNIRVLQPGKEIPYAGDTEAQISALAEDLMKDVKPAFKRSTVKNGSGSDSATGGPGSGGGKAAVFEQVREKAKNANKGSGNDIDPEKELHRRLGITAPA
jgi:hypothetical protein